MLRVLRQPIESTLNAVLGVEFGGGGVAWCDGQGWVDAGEVLCGPLAESAVAVVDEGHC
ncbi:hypothetical protein CIP107528_01979 [Corynebacterium diphtheriae]|nr:hypothetical protein CIP107528_01979 [Corynebacterium diphtheriae]